MGRKQAGRPLRVPEEYLKYRTSRGTSAPTPSPAGWEPGRSPCRGPPWRSSSKRARFHHIYLKVSQNGKVSPKSAEKASRSPCFQNGLRKSPLGIPRIRNSLAFSHKELMGLFRRGTDFYVKMTKCRPDVHTDVHAKGSSDTPTMSTQQAASVDIAPHLTQRARTSALRYSQRTKKYPFYRRL